MKKFLAILAVLFGVSPAFAAGACTTIQSGTLMYQSGLLANTPILPGVDPYGYNYQAKSFNGSFMNAYANAAGLTPYDGDDAAYLAIHPTAINFWAWPYRDSNLAMKWNSAWLDNKDCNGDGKLDRHYGFPSYVGSGAWLTNHDSWTITVDGHEKTANDFLKVVAMPANAYVAAPVGYFGEGTVYVDGKVMGDQLWGEFAVVQYVLNDQSTGDHGLRLKGQINAGLASAP